MGFAKPIEQIFIKLSRCIYVSKRYYTRRIIMQMNYYENLWIELPDGIQKMTEDEKKLFLSTDVIRFCMDR